MVGHNDHYDLLMPNGRLLHMGDEGIEERVMDVLVEDMTMRTTQHMRPVLVVNLDVKDNAAEAANAAPQV